ncbi:MAG: hypothetical protein ACREVK_11855 [Gammaproteobacteria bacterium]
MGTTVSGSNYGANLSETEVEKDVTSAAIAQPAFFSEGDAKSKLNAETETETEQRLRQETGDAEGGDVFNIG